MILGLTHALLGITALSSGTHLPTIEKTSSYQNVYQVAQIDSQTQNARKLGYQPSYHGGVMEGMPNSLRNTETANDKQVVTQEDKAVNNAPVKSKSSNKKQ